ncbi:MAG: hypothetical protein CM15mV93_260 [Caudoviricetes sp.]|nr:MAG: hypothetical protein CM15mV93_260 [Caudoviricetes sp.]
MKKIYTHYLMSAKTSEIEKDDLEPYLESRD